MKIQIKEQSYFHNAIIGEEVVSTEKGKGIISFISKGKPRLISVNFENGGYWIYSEEGKSTDESEQTLFYSNDILKISNIALKS